MILNVSGRCDICAFYSDWFFHRLKEGYVDVRNPYNEHQISRILLDVENIDMILFCTKNPIPMLHRLEEIKFPYVFHITLTPYHEEIETNVPNKKEIIKAIQYLSNKIGKDKVIVRYDPILLSKRYTILYHEKAFASLCEQLSGFVENIIISFVDMYKNTREHAKEMELSTITIKQMEEIAKRFSNVAKKYQIKVQTCAESVDLTKYGIYNLPCFDKEVIENWIGYQIKTTNKGVRNNCACIPTVDIGDYNCCFHGCKYCYANYDMNLLEKNKKRHDKTASILLGKLGEEDSITIRKNNVKKMVKKMI